MTYGGIFDYAEKEERLTEVERELQAADIWNNPERAQALAKQYGIPRVESSVASLLENCAPQLVDVILPPQAQFQIQGESSRAVITKRRSTH